MRFFRRRSAGTAKDAALAAARRATATARQEDAKVDRYRAKKQSNPADRMTTNQWIGGGN